MRLVVAALVLTGCYTQSAAPPLSNKPVTKVARDALTIRRDRVGAIHADTPALLLPLRRVLAGYEVRPVNDGSLEYHVFQNGEHLAYVVPSDGDALIFNIHAVSPKVVVAGRSWRVGAPFEDAERLTNCECWGDNPTCYKAGDTIAVNFARECAGVEGAGAEQLRALDGEKVARIVWSPRPFTDSVD